MAAHAPQAGFIVATSRRQARRRPGCARPGDAQGQVAPELVAIVPILLVVTLGLGQLAVAGYSLWSAAGAARAGARAALVGGDAERAALSALPRWLGDEAEVAVEGPVEVRVEAPALLPGIPALPVSAAASLDPEAADGAR